MKTKKRREMTLAELIAEGTHRVESAQVYFIEPFKDRFCHSPEVAEVSDTLGQVLQLLQDACTLLEPLRPAEEEEA